MTKKKGKVALKAQGGASAEEGWSVACGKSPNAQSRLSVTLTQGRTQQSSRTSERDATVGVVKVESSEHQRWAMKTSVDLRPIRYSALVGSRGKAPR